MRTVTKEVYSFDELNEDAKQTAIDYYRNNWVCSDYIYDEAHETVKKFHEIFGTSEGRRSWLEVSTDSIDNNVLELKGLRLQKYIWNNYAQYLYKGKYYNYKGNTSEKLIHKRIESIYYPNRQYWGNYYYSAITKDNSCTLTGVCCDYSLLQPIYDFLDNYRSKPNYHNNLDFETLINDCFASLEKDLQSEEESLSEDENIIESIEANEYEWNEDGTPYRP